jgi:RHS repeat-associated protein
VYRYDYDAEGNRVSRWIDVDADGVLDSGDTDITQYLWDTRNRLARVSNFADFAALGGKLPEKVVDYLYDVENRWIGESIDSNGDGQIDHQIRFAYDGNQIILQFEKAGEGPVTGADLSHRYLWQPDAVDQLMADEQVHFDNQQEEVVTDKLLWALTDHLGTVRDLAVYNLQTGTTTVANHRIYDSYGVLVSETDSTITCLIGYTGRPRDNTTGLQNNLNRWYDARTGRWMSKDPSGLSADVNPYRYCGNNSVIYVDPTGLDRWLIGGWGQFGHMSIVVEIWANGKRTGRYTQLNFSIAGYSSIEVPKPDPKSVLSQLASNQQQDHALLNKWKELQSSWAGLGSLAAPLAYFPRGVCIGASFRWYNFGGEGMPPVTARKPMPPLPPPVIGLPF